MFDLFALLGLLAAGLTAGALFSGSDPEEEEPPPPVGNDSDPDGDLGDDASGAMAPLASNDQDQPQSEDDDFFAPESGAEVHAPEAGPYEEYATDAPRAAGPGSLRVQSADAPLSADRDAEDGPDAPAEDGGDATSGLALQGGDGDEQLFGTEDEDWLSGGAGNDSLHGGLGDDDLSGGSGADELRGEHGDDSLYGGDGDDTLYGGAGADQLHGGSGVDWLSGGGGDDHLTAGDGGSSTLDGDAGNDTLIGTWFDLTEGPLNYLNGGAGDDLLRIGGADIASGGAGADLFEIAASTTTEGGIAQITDFDPAQDELIVVYDSLDPPPVLSLAPGALPDETLLLVNGHPMAEILGGHGLSTEAIRLVPQHAS